MTQPLNMWYTSDIHFQYPYILLYIFIHVIYIFNTICTYSDTFPIISIRRCVLSGGRGASSSPVARCLLLGGAQEVALTGVVRHTRLGVRAPHAAPGVGSTQAHSRCCCWCCSFEIVDVFLGWCLLHGLMWIANLSSEMLFLWGRSSSQTRWKAASVVVLNFLVE